jgi:tetratricopeptide (TPR) repeat protein
MAAPAFIARYEVKQCLGRGGMGAIYLARDPLIDRLVAVKLLHGDIATDEFRARFVKEAHASGGLSHPHIVTIHDYGEADGAPFIVMEYVRGETLASLIRRAAPVPVIQKLQWTEQICNALGYAHSERIIHRDIKPSNLMLDQHGTIKVVDFGIARLAGGLSTKMSSVIGTPGYMSPEQIQGGTIDARSDIFALGAVLYELLSYREAFAGETPHAVMHKVIAEEPPPLSQLVTGPDLSIVPVVARAMQKAPAVRYQTMIEFETAVREARIALERTGHDLTVHEPRPEESPRSRRRTDPAALARRRAEQIHQHLTRARRAKSAGDVDGAVEACEDALLMDPGSADALDLLEAIRREAAAVSPPPAAPPAPRTTPPPAALAPPPVVLPPTAVTPRVEHERARLEPDRAGAPVRAARTLEDTAPLMAVRTDVGEQAIRPWETDQWGDPQPPSPIVTVEPASGGRRAVLLVSGVVLVASLAGILWMSVPRGTTTTTQSPTLQAEPSATAPDTASGSKPPLAPVTEPSIVPSPAESQPPPVVADPERKAVPDTMPPAPAPGREPAARPATRADPVAAARTLQRADMFRTSGDFTQALSLYREALRLDPANSAAAQAILRIRMEYLLRRARSLVEGEDYDAALKDLDAIAMEDPNNKDADALRSEIAALKAGAAKKPKG